MGADGDSKLLEFTQPPGRPAFNGAFVRPQHIGNGGLAEIDDQVPTGLGHLRPQTPPVPVIRQLVEENRPLPIGHPRKYPGGNRPADDSEPTCWPGANEVIEYATRDDRIADPV